MVMCTSRLRSISCSFAVSAEIWPLNGKITRTVSSAPLDGYKGCCWSQTFESAKLLMLELTRLLGVKVFKRLYSSEKCDQDEDKRCARPNMVLSKPFFVRLSLHSLFFFHNAYLLRERSCPHVSGYFLSARTLTKVIPQVNRHFFFHLTLK